MKELIELTVNGRHHQIAVRPHWTLLEALRYELRLTGTKQGCDKGDCGACTVLVNGESVLSCLMLASATEGKTIRTIEGLSANKQGADIQRAFDASGAMQCGFCQPGMMLSTYELLSKNSAPSEAQIKEALSGNLCRCTGYTKIFDAVNMAASGVTECHERQSDAAKEHTVIGRGFRKHDSADKTTGAAVYTDDIALPGMLHGKLLRSPHAHANIIDIDISKAESMDGVFAVITGEDLPQNFGIIPWTPDETALAVGKVRHIGEAVAAVAAIDEETAIEALKHIQVTYKPLTQVISIDDAIAEDAPLVHDKDWKGRERKSNLCKEVSLSFGEVDKALQEAAVTVSGHWSYSGSTHAAMEPHCCVANFDADGQLTLYSATQVSHYLQRELAKVLTLDQSKVRVIQPALGGAFGGKSEPFDLEFAAAELSRRTGAPVKILYTREEVFYAHRGRHPMEFDLTITADDNGKITAVDNDVLIDGGAYHSFGLVTTYYSGQLLCGPLDFGSYRFRARRFYTNKPACGPKRGHGAVQPRFPLETALDEVAHKLNIDPIEIRRINALPAVDTETVNGQRILTNGILECLDVVEERSGWKSRYNSLPAGKGLGVATSMYISGTAYPVYPNDMPQSAVILQADRSGRLTLFAGVNEIGQGADTMLAAIAAEEVGVPLDQIRVVSGDTDLSPVDLGAYSSRITLMAGNAAREAALSMRKLLTDAIVEKWEVTADRLAHKDGTWFDTLNPEKCAPINEVFQWAEAKSGVLVSTGNYFTEKGLGGEYRGGAIGASPAYSATAHVAEVDVDLETGEVKVLKVWAAHDCGKAINPIAVEGQIEGSVYMGVSEAVLEDMPYYDTGLHQDPSLLGYRIQTSQDVPEIEAHYVETNDPAGPYGAKEAGEGPLHPAIPAVANAIWKATGARIRTMPFTPDRVLAAIKASRSELES